MVLRILIRGDKYGLKNAYTNKVVVEPIYKDMALIRKNPRFYRAEDQRGNNGVLSGTTGKVIVPFKYDHIHFLRPNFFELYLGDLNGVALLNGKVIIPPTYEYLSYNKFYDLFEVGTGYSEMGIINGKGKIIVPLEYESIDMHRMGLEVLTEKGKVGMYSHAGKLLIPVIFAELYRRPSAYYVVAAMKEGSNKTITFKILHQKTAPFYQTIRDIFNAI